MGELRNCTDPLIQKKENKRSQPVSGLASIFINEEDLLVENVLEEPNNRKEAKSMLKKLNLNIEWASATEDFRKVRVGTCSLVINSIISNPGGVSSNSSFLIF